LRRYDYVQSLGASKYEPSLALACYVAWRDIAWDGGVSFPKPGVARWEELSSDFTTAEPRELNLETVLLNYRSPWTGKGPAAFRPRHAGLLRWPSWRCLRWALLRVSSAARSGS